LAVWKRCRLEILPFLSSFFLILSFPPYNIEYLAWVSLLPLLFYCRKQVSPGKSFWGGFCTGLVFFLCIYAYIALSVNFVLPRYVGVLVVIASAFYSALFYGVFSLLIFYFLRGTMTVLSVLSAPSVWVLLEYLRSLGLLGHTGGFLGFSQSYHLLLQPIAFYGYWGLPFLIVLFQTILFFLCCNFNNRQQKNRSFKKAVVLLFIFLVMLAGGICLPSFFPIQEKDKPLRIALIQGNIPQENILDPAMSVDNFRKYIELSEKAYRLYAPLDLLVWPETVFSASLARQHPAVEKEITSLATKLKTSILYGAMCEEKPAGETFNSILLCESGRSSQKKQRSDKLRLVPFAEYFPFPEILNNIWKTNISLGTYTPGTNIRTFQLDGFKFGGIICFESYFAHPALQIPQMEGEHIFILSNDAWFLESSGLEQHARAAIVRALETGLGVTQVANTGYTVSYDYAGREILKLPALSEGIGLLETKIPVRQTLYLLWGDYFLYFCLLVLFLQIVVKIKRFYPQVLKPQ